MVARQKPSKPSLPRNCERGRTLQVATGSGSPRAWEGAASRMIRESGDRSHCTNPAVRGERPLVGELKMKRAMVVGLTLICFKITSLIPGLDVVAWGGAAGPPTAGVEPMLLERVVVTATRVEVPVTPLPSAITVIDRQEIESRQVTDALQLLRTVPGLNVTQVGSGGGVTTVFPRGGISAGF